MAPISGYFEYGTFINLCIMVVVKANVETNIISAKTVNCAFGDGSVQSEDSVSKPLMGAVPTWLTIEKIEKVSTGDLLY